MNLQKSIKHFLHGLLMGGADIIPGVSGGTMALIVGVYEDLVAAISHIFTAALSLLRLDLATVRDRLGQVKWGMLIPLVVGIGTALVVGATFIPGLLERYPVQCRAFFFGLIIGSLVIPWQRIVHPSSRDYLIAVVAAVVAFVLVGLPPREIAAPSLLYVFLSAMVAICAMILPGISGSFLLLVLGIYGATLNALNSRDMGYVLTFIAGAGLGIGLFSKLLDRLLDRYHDITMAALVGLMAGSLRALWPWLAEDRRLMWPDAGDPIVPVIALAVLGVAIVLGLYALGNRSVLQVNSSTQP